MHNYDFSTLSDYEFEQLAGDLLQCELNVTLERFAPGRDSGIDLRLSYKSSGGNDVFQCKHYLRSGYSKLLGAIKKEIPKIKVLKPNRYFLVTSVDLTPKNKAEIFSELAPFCEKLGDIYGASDLNNLLVKFQQVETKHFKLWLSSVPVLERILHSRILGESTSEIGRIQDRISKYVICGQFALALDLLKERNVCIISGPPGVGKTTLAEIVLAHFLRDGYECIKIPLDISDARAVFKPDVKQVFYYDDFLGKTSLVDKLNKNEDDRIVRFVKDIQKTKASKFILTTREYILRQAQGYFEGFRHANIDLYKLVLEIDCYTILEKARILYNHLFFSGLPKEIVKEAAKAENYSRVIEHKNYNPRIIEFMTDLFNFGDIGGVSYFDFFVGNLDHPTQIWVTAFKKHIPSSAQDFLICLLSLPTPIAADDLQEAYQAFHEVRSKKYIQHSSPYDFRDALKELEGSFIKTEKCRKHLLVDFHNPSVIDFLESHLAENVEDLRDLARCVKFPDQISQIFSLLKRTSTSSSDFFDNELFKGLISTFQARSVRLIRHSSYGGRNEYWDYFPITLERKLTSFLECASKEFLACSFPEFHNLLTIYQNLGTINGYDLYRLMDAGISTWPNENLLKEDFFSWARGAFLALLKKTYDLEDVKGFIRCYEYFGGFSKDDTEVAKAELERLVQEEIRYIENDSPLLSDVEDRVSDLKSFSETLGMDFEDELDEALSNTKDPDYPDDDRDYSSNWGTKPENYNAEIEHMFSLLDQE